MDLKRKRTGNIEEEPPARLPQENLDPDGDLILLVSDTLPLKVSSKVLCLASPVFRAMLKGRFTEAHALRNAGNDQIPTVTLPDDDKDAMRGLCHILHWNRGDLFPAHFSIKYTAVKLPFKICLVADKYDCIPCIRDAIEKPLNGLDCDLLFQDCADAIGAAYLLKSPQVFRKASYEVAYGMGLFFGETEYAPDITGEVIPAHAISQLERLSTDTKHELAATIKSLLIEPLAVELDNETRSPISAEVEKLQRIQKMVQDLEKSAPGEGTLMDSVQDVHLFVLADPRESASFSESFVAKMKEIEVVCDEFCWNDKERGLCLQCVMNEQMIHGHTLSECREHHTHGKTGISNSGFLATQQASLAAS